MASSHGFSYPAADIVFNSYSSSSSKNGFLVRPSSSLVSCSSIPPVRIRKSQNPRVLVTWKRSKFRDSRLFNSVELERFLTSEDDEMSEEFLEAIGELERMTREPSDVLEQMNDRLSARELQLVLVYFAQEGRDSWCALEVFEWLRKENRVDEETMELMVSIMCGWFRKLIEGEHEVGDVVELLVDMDCVGLKPDFSMMEKVISLYWESGKKDHAVSFVGEVLRRGIVCRENDEGDGQKGGPTGYLAWKMMVEGDYREAAKLVMHLHESGLKPELYSYIIALTALVKELNEFAKALRKLRGFTKAGLLAEDAGNAELIEKYQSNILAEGLCLANWVIQEGNSSLQGVAYERLLAMYICAGRGIEAERQLWEMKLVGKDIDRGLYDIVLAICASKKESNAIARLLTLVDIERSVHKKKTLSWLLRGYIKGGFFEDACQTVIKMLEFGVNPDYVDRVAVLQGLRRRIQHRSNLDTYLKLCKHLSDANLIGPCLVYMYIKKYKLWIIQML